MACDICFENTTVMKHCKTCVFNICQTCVSKLSKCPQCKKLYADVFLFLEDEDDCTDIFVSYVQYSLDIVETYIDEIPILLPSDMLPDEYFWEIRINYHNYYSRN
jgi:hypothetical protein